MELNKAVYRSAFDMARMEHPDWGIPDLPETATVQELDAVSGIKTSVDCAWLSVSENMHYNLIFGKTVLNNQDKAKIAIAAVRAVHDRWICENFDKKYEPRIGTEQGKQFLSLEAIGWDETKKDLIFVRPVLSAHGITISDDEIKGEYGRCVKRYVGNLREYNNSVKCYVGNLHSVTDTMISKEGFYLQCKIGSQTPFHKDPRFVKAVESTDLYKSIATGQENSLSDNETDNQTFFKEGETNEDLEDIDW